MSEKKLGYFVINNTRLSYLYCFEPFIAKPTPQNPKPKPNYCVHALLPPEHPDLPRLAALIDAVGAAHAWKGEGVTWEMVKAQLKGSDKLCLHRGDVTKAGKPEYAGQFFLSANNDKRFTTVDGDRTPLTAADGKLYSGCYGNVIVDIYAQDNSWGRRINATVTGVQFVRHSTAFGGGGSGPAAPDEFGIVATSADAPAPAASVDPLGGLV